MFHSKLLWIIENMLGKHALCPILPLWLTLCPTNWSPLGKGHATRRYYLCVIVPFPTILTTFHSSSISCPHVLVFLGVLTQEGITPHLMGRRG
jgi:hypothetical protein